MSILKRFPISRPFVAAGVLLSSVLLTGHNLPATFRFDARAHIERGDRVEKRYNAYSQQLSQHYVALLDAVKRNAPDLVGSLQPRGPLLYGYQVLPRTLADMAVEQPPRTGSIAYSWPWTDRLIDRALEEIVASETGLRRLAEIEPIKRRAVLKKLAQTYDQHSRRLQNIHAHVQYNRFWQAAIAKQRAGYDRETALYWTIVARTNILTRVNRVGSARAVVDARFRHFSENLSQRAALLTQRIDQVLEYVRMPNFVELETFSNELVFIVPLVTDIKDREYVQAVKQVIENTWQLHDGNKHYRVKLDLAYVSPDALYSENERPVAGHNIDLERHLGRFPPGRAILTSGARTTHVQRNAIVLGPQAITARVLAHEFGHVLGFRDRYVRGYEDLGKDGFQVLEIVVDEKDIMAGTSHGAVQRNHFLQLLKQAARRVDKKPEPAAARQHPV
jgi:hypothetical protein